MGKSDIEKRILDYLPMVRYIVGRLGIHPPPPLDMDDLFEVGAMGLVKAAQSYRDDKNASFKTHAYHHIRGAILDELRRHHPVSRAKRDRLREMNRAYEAFLLEHHRPPSHSELAEAIGISEDDLDDLLVDARTLHVVSLSEKQSASDSGRSQRTLICPRSRTPADLSESSEIRDLLVREIEQLPETDRTVLLLYYNEGLLLREIGELLNKSESRISQIHARALFLLTSRLEAKQGRDPGDLPAPAGS